MKVLICHNRYQQRGGEDSVFESETQLLRSFGHEVQTFERDNEGLQSVGKLKLLADTIWSSASYAELTGEIKSFRPDIIHVHNTFARLSPSIYSAAARLHVPVVQTLHNFRLLCPQALLMRESRVCEDCVGRLPWRGVVHGCYRGSRAQTAALAATVTVHRALGTWSSKVSRYIALNDFCMEVFVRGGLPRERLRVKPNFVEDRKIETNSGRRDFLYVGRLSEEKGIDVLSSALALVPKVNCHVVGTGEMDEVIRTRSNAVMHGWQGSESINALMHSSLALVMPSVWYENFPRTLVEAFSAGLPVVASRLGAMAALIADGKTGLLFDPCDPTDLAKKLEWAQAHPEEMGFMGERARNEYERKYTPAKNHEQLVAIYREAIEEVAR
jgi:glycosyltransferase involved in cell wall biosynthesis